MAEKVTFIETTQDRYSRLALDNYTFYYCTDTDRCFLGGNELTNDEDIQKVMAALSVVETKADSAQETADDALNAVEATKSIYYGTSSSQANTTAKTVTCSGFTLETGATICIRFTNANTATSPTLNVNSTGAHSIAAYGTTAAGTSSWHAGAVLIFTYDGSSWIINNYGPADTTYYGITKLSSSVSDTSTNLAATASAVKEAYDLANTANQAAESAVQSVSASTPLNASTSNGTVTLTHSNSGATAGTYGPTANSSPSAGGTFTVPSLAVDIFGHVTSANNRTITLPTSSDTLVTQTVTTTSSNYPLLLTNTASKTSTSTDTARFASNITANPGTGTITATTFSGTATTATNLGTATVGSGTHPIYLNNGSPTAGTSTVGDSDQPVYLSNGVITACTDLNTTPQWEAIA